MDFGLIVDLETTGLNPEQDQIIEIGLLEFMWGGGLESPIITNMYGALQDPGVELSPEIQRITGLNDLALKGQQIDWDIVRKYLQRAEVIIAHNAEFDRAFLQRRAEVSDIDMHWACSIRHVDWHGKNITSRRLSHIAADHGFVNPFPHRALFDCATTYRIVAPHLGEVVARSYEREVMVRALGAAFATKDKLKTRGYRWNPQGHVWEKRIFESRLDDERTFLSIEIYQGECRHSEDHL